MDCVDLEFMAPYSCVYPYMTLVKHSKKLLGDRKLVFVTLYFLCDRMFFSLRRRKECCSFCFVISKLVARISFFFDFVLITPEFRNRILN